MVEFFLGLGTNLGDREGNLQQAISRLGAALEVQALSSFYETDPVGYLEQPSFVNAVCRGQTELAPQELLALARAVELEMGRKPTFPNGPRLIDIDILAYGSWVLKERGLTIPHPRLAERAFVLVPLAEIAPGWRHPLLGKTAAELSAAVSQAGVRLLVGAGS